MKIHFKFAGLIKFFIYRVSRMFFTGLPCFEGFDLLYLFGIAMKCEVADPLRTVVMEWVREFAWSMFILNKRKE